MRIVFVVRRNNEYLFYRKKVSENYELPFVQCTDSREGIKKLKKEISNLGFGIEMVGCVNHNSSNDEDIEIYEARLYSWTSNSKGVWLGFDEMCSANYEEWCVYICKGLLEKLRDELEICTAIEREINTVAEEAGLHVEFAERDKDITVFIKSDSSEYCPYIFSLAYEREDDKTVTLNVVWRVSRMFASGEKSDLYVLFANSMNIILKVLFNDLAQIVYIGHPVCSDEIGGAAIVLNNKLRSIAIHDLSEAVNTVFGKFFVAMQMHYILFGSYGLLLRKDMLVDVEWIMKEVNVDNTIRREDCTYYTNYEHGISVLELNEKQYKPELLTEYHEWNVVDGIDGKIIVQYEGDGKSYNLIPLHRWEIIQRIIESNKCKKYSIVCQENMLYLLESNRIWILDGGYYHYWAEQEKEKILERQKQENEILFFDKNFKWKYPIKPSRFEELIADLLEVEPRVSRVRLVGKSNNSDGGRDILVYKMVFDDKPQNNEEYLVVGQCKAYKNSVNKSHVIDIRDMLENYNAKGFVLAVASDITVPLIDNLNKLSEKYEVEWWTEREIFSKLRRNYYLLERYKDIVEIVGNE